MNIKTTLKGLQVTYKQLTTGRIIELKPQCSKSNYKGYTDWIFADGEYITDGFSKGDEKWQYKLHMTTNRGRTIEQGHGGSNKKTQKIPFDIKKTKGHVVGFKIAIKSEVLSIGVFHRPLD